MATVCYYHYRKLDRASQITYLKIADAIRNWHKTVMVQDSPNLANIVTAVNYDNPQFFYVDLHTFRSTLYTQTNTVEIYFTYLMKIDEARPLYEKFLKKAKELRGETPEMTVANTFRFLTENVTYDVRIHTGKKRWQNHNLYGPLIDNLAVCEGISKAMHFILHINQVECATIFGQIVKPHKQKTYHAWNLIRYNGQYRYFDATWDLSENNGDLLYYYNVPADELSKTRVW